ncbi:MAG: hypothetical protein J6U40_03905, partial [Kiritimatiellae bacterium]|nr:hypothetical protein [Kiritimatiellia bacterium]
SWGCSARLFGCRIWQDGNLVRDYRPCMKDGQAALYDAVEERIYFPAGGNLLAPSDEPIFFDYVQATGSQHVNTGVEGRYGTTVEAVFSDWTGAALFGAVGLNNMHYLGMRAGGNLRFIYSASGNGNSDTYTAVDYTAEAKRTVKTEVTDAGAINVYVDGDVKMQKAALGQYTTGLDMYVFAGNNRGGRDWPGSVKLHGLKIWQDGALVRDFLPCRKNDLVGLYDVENARFYPSLGALTGSEKSSPRKFVEYVASSGTQYIDTCVVGRYGTTVEAHFRDMMVANTALFGAVNGGVHFLGMCNAAGSGLRFIYNRSGGAGDVNPPLVFGAGAEHDITCSVTTDGALAISADGELKAQTAALGRVSSGIDMYVFAGNNSGSAPDWACTVKLYGLRIWQDGVLLRDFRPCIGANGKAALYDMLNSQHYYPKSGELTASETEVPATAVWKGGAVASAADFASAANWACFGPGGEALAGLVPTEQTTVVLAGAADPLLALPAGVKAPRWGDVKLTNSVTLSAAADWSGLGRLTLGNAVTVDLNGNALTVAQFVADGEANATFANSGASVATLTVTGAEMTSLERITLGDTIKIVKSGTGSLGKASDMYIGRSGNVFEVEMTEGAFWLEGNLRLGYDAPGTFTIGEGAKVRVNDSSVGHYSGGVGTLNLTGGEFYSTKDLWFGAFEDSVGTFVQSGGTAVIGLVLRLAGANASSTSARGSFVQTGGTLEVSEIFHGAGVAEVTFNGGTLKPRTANAAFFRNLDNVTLGAGGVTIDTAYDIGAVNTMVTVQNGGKIVKTGTGTFDLSGITVQMDASVTSSFDFAVVAEGTDEGGFSGLPAVPSSWTARLTLDGRTCRISRKGSIIIIR